MPDPPDTWTLDDATLARYIAGFYGHGSYAAPLWFVGMEFGGGNSVDEICGRIQGWADRGGAELEDMRPGVDHGPPLVPRPPATAAHLGAPHSRHPRRAERGQRRHGRRFAPTSAVQLGRTGGRDCLIELLPLPSRNQGTFRFYPEHSRLPYLQTRAAYVDHVAPQRVAHLRARIAEHQPRAVICYGVGFAGWWRELAGGAALAPAGDLAVMVAQAGPTLFVQMQHPTAHGVPHRYFDAIGALIAPHVASARLTAG